MVDFPKFGHNYLLTFCQIRTACHLQPINSSSFILQSDGVFSSSDVKLTVTGKFCNAIWASIIVTLQSFLRKKHHIGNRLHNVTSYENIINLLQLHACYYNENESSNISTLEPG